MAVQREYSLATESGFAILEQIHGPYADDTFAHDAGDSRIDELVMTGVYGGEVALDELENYLVYRLSLPEDMGAEDDEWVEAISEQLDELFPGWILDREQGRVYVVPGLGEDSGTTPGEEPGEQAPAP